jgi:hypothetical protein
MGTLRTCVAGALLCSALLAQDRGDAWFDDALGALRRMEVVGDSPWSRERIAAALAMDLNTLRGIAALSEREQALRFAKRARELHRRAGYADAVVGGDAANGRLLLAVNAGRRHRRGELRCSGNHAVSDAALLAAAAAAGTGTGDANDTTWLAGEHGALDERVTARAAAAVVGAYRDVGRHGARATAAFVRDADRMALAIAVTDEGREVRIRNVRLAGELDDEQAAAVLAAVRPAPDALATTAVLDELRRRIEATGLYRHARVAVGDEPAAVLDPLVVDVVPRPDAPPFTAAGQRDAQQVQRAIDRLLPHVRDGALLRCRVVCTWPVPMGAAVLFPGTVELRWGKDGVACDVERLAIGAGPARRFALATSGGELVVTLGERGWRWRLPKPIAAQLTIATRFGASGGGEVVWTLDASTWTRPEIVFALHEGTAAHLLTRSDVRRDGDDLLLGIGGAQARIGSDGEVVGRRAVFTHDGNTYELSWNDDDTPPVPRSEVATPAALLELAATLLLDALPQSARGDARVAALLRGCTAASSDRELDAAASPADARDEPRMPALDDDAHRRPFAASIAAMAAAIAVDRSIDGRWSRLAALVGVRATAEPADATIRRAALLRDEASGPLVLALAACWYDLVGEPRWVQRCRDEARARWDLARFQADAADLLRHVAALRALPARVGAHWRTQPELNELLGELPAGEPGDLLAWRKGIEHLWNAGAGDLLRELLLGK